jgi:hypothetical protein
MVNFYASNMAYAENYKFISNEDGEVISECALEVKEVENVTLFDMEANFKTLTSFDAYIAGLIGIQMRDYTRFFNNAKKASDRKMWAKQIDELKNREVELIAGLFSNEFQSLSDFDNQFLLVVELKSKGFDGYFTKNEIALF